MPGPVRTATTDAVGPLDPPPPLPPPAVAGAGVVNVTSALVVVPSWLAASTSAWEVLEGESPVSGTLTAVGLVPAPASRPALVAP